MRMLFAAGVLAWASVAHGEVVDAQAGGFEVRHSLHVDAPPARVYEAIAHVGRWWNGEHTYSGDASRLTLEAIAGGCFCESLPDGGSVQHMRVVMAQPGKVLRLEGALGPLQRLGVSGHLTWALTPKDNGTDLVQLYDIGGYAKGGLAELASPVDQVLGEQVQRLKRYIENGKP